jgi:hypothetical protein
MAAPDKAEINRILRRFGDSRARSYWRELGLFLELFASMEVFLIEALEHYCRLSPTAGRVLFSGLRAKDAGDHIKKILAASGVKGPRTAELEEALAQMSLLNTARNDLVHYGRQTLLSTSRRIIVSNIERAKLMAETHVRGFEATPDMLRAMSMDTLHIIWVLMAHSVNKREERRHRNHPLSKETLAWPWLYTPPQPILPGRILRQTGQGYRRRQRSSRK